MTTVLTKGLITDMRIVIESTDQLCKIEGVRVRVWDGTTERGVKVKCFITAIAVEALADEAAFERELVEAQAPRPVEPRTYLGRMIL